MGEERRGREGGESANGLDIRATVLISGLVDPTWRHQGRERGFQGCQRGGLDSKGDIASFVDLDENSNQRVALHRHGSLGGMGGHQSRFIARNIAYSVGLISYFSIRDLIDECLWS